MGASSGLESAESGVRGFMGKAFGAYKYSYPQHAANFIAAHEAPMLVNLLLPVGVQFAGRAVVNEAGCDGSPLRYCP